MSVMNTLQILIEARKLIEKPENWASSAYGLGETCNCALTAIDVAGGGYSVAAAFCKANNIDAVGVYGGVIDFNDTHAHPEVLAAFDAAIARASTESA